MAKRMNNSGNTHPTTSTELLPCPFCGKLPKLLFNHEAGSGECWSVECEPCDIGQWGEYRHTANEAQKSAAAKWNTRQPQSPSTSLSDATAFEILNKHCEYHDGLSRGQRWVSADSALAAVREVLAMKSKEQSNG